VSAKVERVSPRIDKLSSVVQLSAELHFAGTTLEVEGMIQVES
jgi:hypothetical protein